MGFFPGFPSELVTTLNSSEGCPTDEYLSRLRINDLSSATIQIHIARAYFGQKKNFNGMHFRTLGHFVELKKW